MDLLIEDKRFYVYAYLDPRKTGDFKYGSIEFKFEPFYIGKGHEERKLDHIFDAKNEKYKSPKLNKIRKIQKQGLAVIIIELFSGITEQEANTKEKILIVLIGRKDLKKGPLLNLTDGGEGTTGIIRSFEYRQKISKRHKNKVLSEETKRKISLSKKGSINSIETRIKISRANLGRIFSEETRRKLSASKKKYFSEHPEAKIAIGNFHRNKTVSMNTRDKLKEKRKFQKRRPCSEETRIKLSQLNKGRIRSEEFKMHMKRIKMGKIPSEETKIKMSKSQKERWRLRLAQGEIC